MPKVKIGYRKLYIAVDCSITDKEEFEVRANFQEYEVLIYFGPKPKLGFTHYISNGKYIINEDGELPFVSMKSYPDVRESSYPYKFLTEISVTKEKQISDKENELLISKDQVIRERLLDEVRINSKIYIEIIDLFAGIIGLKFHPQFVLEDYDGNPFVLMDEGEKHYSISGPAWRLLDGISLNKTGQKMMTEYLQNLNETEHKSISFGKVVLSWLLRSWQEDKLIPKFVSFFITLEALLKNYHGDKDWEEEKRKKNDRIKSILLDSSERDSQELLSYFEKLVINSQPSLTSRFEQLAKDKNLDGWEKDVKAFRKFNRMRNLLLHQAKDDVNLSILINDQEIKNLTIQLEDLVERYVSIRLFGDMNVYKSRFHPNRK